jgi:hypothetical protein
MADEWHVSVDGAQRGPLTSEQVRSLVSSGRLKPTDHVWRSGMSDWVVASSVQGLFSKQMVSPQHRSGPPPVQQFAASIHAGVSHAASLNIVEFGSLPFPAKAALAWSFFWRTVVTTIASSFLGGILGAIIGFVLGFVGFPIGAIQFAGGLLGLGVGLACFFILVQWLLTSRLGKFRLKLVRADK